MYLCAYLPRNGQSLLELGSSDAEQLILPNLVMSEDRSTVGVRPEIIRDALFADCTEGHYLDWVRRMISREPSALAMTPVQISAERFGPVPRIYIECLADRAISPPLQGRMYTATPCARLLTMSTGHSPHYSDPHALAEHLLSAAE